MKNDYYSKVKKYSPYSDVFFNLYATNLATHRSMDEKIAEQLLDASTKAAAYKLNKGHIAFCHEFMDFCEKIQDEELGEIDLNALKNRKRLFEKKVPFDVRVIQQTQEVKLICKKCGQDNSTMAFTCSKCGEAFDLAFK